MKKFFLVLASLVALTARAQIGFGQPTVQVYGSPSVVAFQTNSGNAGIAGNLYVGGTSSLAGAVTVNSLVATNNSTVYGSILAGNNITSGGNLSSGGTLNVVGLTGLAGLTNSGNTGLAGTLYVGGASSLANTTIGVSGASTNSFLTVRQQNQTTSDINLGNGGTWFSSSQFPIPYFSPVTDKTTFNMDLFPHDVTNTANYKIAFDIVDRDIASGGSSVLAVSRWLHSGIDTTFGFVDINKGVSASNIPLLIGQTSSALGIGGFSAGDLPLSGVPVQMRLASGYNLSIVNRNDTAAASTASVNIRSTDNSGTAIPLMLSATGSRIFNRVAGDVDYSVTASGSNLLLRSVKDDNATFINTVSQGSKFYWSFDANQPASVVFAQWRPATGVNLSMDNVSTSGRLAAFNDSATSIPLIYQASTHSITTDGNVTYVATFANNAATIKNLTTSGYLAFPPVSSTGRNAIPTPAAGTTVFNTTTSMIEVSDGNAAGDGTGWYRVSQRSIFSVSQTSNFTVTADVDFVRCNTTGGAFSVTLPAATSWSGRQITVKDTGGSANVNNITVKSAGGNLDGTAAATGIAINTAYGKATYYSDGTQWWSK